MAGGWCTRRSWGGVHWSGSGLLLLLKEDRRGSFVRGGRSCGLGGGSCGLGGIVVWDLRGFLGFSDVCWGSGGGGPGAGVRRYVLRVPLHGGVSGAVWSGFHTLLLEVLRTCPTITSFDNKVLRRVNVLHDFLEALSFGHVRQVELRLVLASDLLPPVRRLLSSASALLRVHPASFRGLVHLVLLVVASASNLVDRYSTILGI